MSERVIPQSATIRVPLQAYLASDHVSPATGLTIAITISKNGGAYGNPSAGATVAVEIANGSYYVDLSTTDTGTVGPLFVRGAVATMDPITTIYYVSTFILQTGDAYARLGAPAGASVSADIAAATVDTAAIKLQTDKLAFTVANQVDCNVLDWKSATAPAMTGDAFARLGAPAGASVSVDVAAIKTDTAAIKTKTDFLPSATAGAAGGVFIAGSNAATSITTGLTAHIIGTVDTVTTLTNLPAITSNWLTAAGIAANALNGKGDWMLTYTQPTGFLAATFPGTVASPTNITAGTMTTVTNLTNAPSAGDFTATMKTSLNAATPAVTVSDKTGFALTAAYDAAKTAAQAGDAMALTTPTGNALVSATAAAVTSDHGAGSYVRNTEPLDAAGTRTAVGLATANLDTQLTGPLAADVKKVNGVTIVGDGSATPFNV